MLAVPVAVALRARTAGMVIVAVTLVVLYGVAIEGLQGVVSTRLPSLADAGANAIGAVVGVTVRTLVAR